MWRAVPGRNGSKLVSTEPPDSDDAKPVRVIDDDAVWVRRGYVVAGVALVTLFLLSGLLTTHSTNLTTITTLNYLRTFSMESPALALDDTDLEDSFAMEGELEGPLHPPRNSNSACNEQEARLKVFMYDLPAAFHYGMIQAPETAGEIWPRNTSAIPRYPGGLYQQHSPEYWLVSDLVTSDMPDRTSPCTAFRVRRWQDADVLLVPFFASLSYNKYSRTKGLSAAGRVKDLNQELQSELLAFLKAQPSWRARAEDHLLVIHHPNSMVAMRSHFRSGIFVVADFGRYGAEVANDIVAPYKHVIPRFETDAATGAASYRLRPTLLFFQGAIVRKQGGVIRQQLHALLHEEPDVVFATGSTTSAGIRSATRGMRESKFCLHLAGDTPSSNRLFDAVASHCLPLVISDEIELPFEDVLDYSQFCVFVSSRDALRKGYVTNLLRNFPMERWIRMHARLQEVQRHFQWQHPTELGDAVHMTWEAISRKLPSLTLARHKRRRYDRSRAGLEPAT